MLRPLPGHNFEQEPARRDEEQGEPCNGHSQADHDQNQDQE